MANLAFKAFNYYSKGRRINRAMGYPLTKHSVAKAISSAALGRPRQSFTKRVNKLIQANHELKFIDTNFNLTTPVSGTSLISLVSAVGEGDTDALRDGQEIYLQSIQCRILLSQDTTPTAATLAKFMVVLARKNVDGALPVMLDLLQSDSIDSLKQIDGRGDFQVLMSEDIILRPPITAGNTQAYWIKYYRKFKKPIKATYDSSGATIAACEKNHLFVVMMTNQATASQPSWIGNVRVTFKD